MKTSEVNNVISRLAELQKYAQAIRDEPSYAPVICIAGDISRWIGNFLDWINVIEANDAQKYALTTTKN